MSQARGSRRNRRGKRTLLCSARHVKSFVALGPLSGSFIIPPLSFTISRSWLSVGEAVLFMIIHMRSKFWEGTVTTLDIGAEIDMRRTEASWPAVDIIGTVAAYARAALPRSELPEFRLWYDKDIPAYHSHDPDMSCAATCQHIVKIACTIFSRPPITSDTRAIRHLSTST